MVLKSRPSSNVKKEEQACLTPASYQVLTGETPISASVTNGAEGRVASSCEEVGGHIPDTGVEEVDGMGIPRTQSDPTASSLMEQAGCPSDEKSSVGVQPTHMHLSAASTGDNVGSELQSSAESSVSSDKHGSGNGDGGEQGGEELDSMLTILDATLLLPPPEEPQGTSPTPPKEAFVPGALTKSHCVVCTYCTYVCMYANTCGHSVKLGTSCTIAVSCRQIDCIPLSNTVVPVN